MVVRIRWHKSPRFALATASLLTPSALVAFTISFWIIASDLRWTKSSFHTGGFFSHWQVWLAAAGILLLIARLLDRYASRSEEYS